MIAYHIVLLHEVARFRQMALARNVLFDTFAWSLVVLPEQETLVDDVSYEIANDDVEALSGFTFVIGERFENFDRIVANSC